MTVRKPLVYDGFGNIEQLQSGDSLSNTQLLPQLTNDNASSIVIGQPVYSSANDHVNLAQANASGTKEVIGLVADTSIAASTTGSIQDMGILSATTAQWDVVVTGESGGLVYKTTYYLDPANAGKLTSTAPTTVGQYVCPVGVAISSTELKINIQRTILL